MVNPNYSDTFSPQDSTIDRTIITPEERAGQRTEVTDNLDQLLDIFPEEIREKLQKHPAKDSIIEVVLDLGRFPEVRLPKTAEYLSETPISREALQYTIDRVGNFGGDNRAGIERTLHRISAIRNRHGEVIGLTCRVGRAILGTVGTIRDLVESGKSLLLLGRPGVGKTTALREIARVLADELQKRVVIIDTSNEIAGDGDIPHPAIGRARRMQVARPELQHQVMIEAVENHMPEVIVIDEIGTELEALAARTIAERGVQLVGTAHGNQIENLIKNPTLSDLVGGIQAVTLGDDEARRRGSQKTVLERKAPPTFEVAVEMLERQSWVVHGDVAQTVDLLLRGQEPQPQLRTMTESGEVTITHQRATRPLPPILTPVSPAIDERRPQGWRASGRMQAIPSGNGSATSSEFERMLDRTWGQVQDDNAKVRTPGPNGEEWPVYVYPYGVGRSQLMQAIELMNLPVVLTKDLDGADAILALRSQIKNHAKLRTLAKARQIPIHPLKSNTMPQIARVLRRLVGLDDFSEGDGDTPDLRLFSANGSDDEIEALEEARLAVEQIVIPKGQPVELLPRSSQVRKMQHELVEHYRLQSDSFGEEPNRRLRIYPA